MTKNLLFFNKKYLFFDKIKWYNTLVNLKNDKKWLKNIFLLKYIFFKIKFTKDRVNLIIKIKILYFFLILVNFDKIKWYNTLVNLKNDKKWLKNIFYKIQRNEAKFELFFCKNIDFLSFLSFLPKINHLIVNWKMKKWQKMTKNIFFIKAYLLLKNIFFW